MTRPLRLLFICMCYCVAVTSSWAQTVREIIVADAGAVSHVPQAVTTTGAITQQGTQAVERLSLK